MHTCQEISLPSKIFNCHAHAILFIEAVVNPITVTIGLAFRRREQALYEIRRIRSYCFQIYISNAVWDWPGKDEKSGRIEAGINWLEHTDQVLEQLIAIGDELTGFLTLPTSSYSFHRTLKSGRKEAAQIIEVGYTQEILIIS